MMYDCKHCGRKVVKDEGGELWLDAGHSRVYINGVRQLDQYCWVDPVHGSQLHEVEAVGEKEIWLVASFQGEEVARLYIAQFVSQEELDVYNDNGSPKKDQLARMLPYGCQYSYIIVAKPAKKSYITETVE